MGFEDIEKLLVREEVNPEKLDDDGDTPLTCAAHDGREGVIKILPEQEGVDPYKPIIPEIHHSRMLLGGDMKEWSKILLEREEVNPNKADNDDQTPLMRATKHSHQRAIELLQINEAVAYCTLSGLGDTTP